MITMAILTDDQSAIKEINNFDESTNFKSGWAFPVVITTPPIYDPKKESLLTTYSMPISGVVSTIYTINTLPSGAQTAISDRDKALTAISQLDNFIANFSNLNQAQINQGVLGIARIVRALAKRGI